MCTSVQGPGHHGTGRKPSNWDHNAQMTLPRSRGCSRPSSGYEKSDLVCQIQQPFKRNSKAGFLCKIWFLNVGNGLKIFIKHPVCQIQPVADSWILSRFFKFYSCIKLAHRKVTSKAMFAWLLIEIFIELYFNMMPLTSIKDQCLFCYAAFLIKIYTANFY